MTPLSRRMGLTAGIAMLAASVLAAQGCPPLRSADRQRMAAAFAIAAQLGDSLWPGWSATPFAIVLVANEHDYFIRHPHPPDSLVSMGYDSLLGRVVACRARALPPNLLATFPLNGVPTVVIGTPEATGKNTTAWVLTLLHEHFHQFQTSQPGYYAAAESLGLSGGDQSGMWMLNYPFPYDSTPIATAFETASRALSAALDAGQGDAGEWATARSRLNMVLGDRDRRYLEFQLWQEGIARYTEYRMARLAAQHFVPPAALTALSDFESFASAADSLHGRILRELASASLAQEHRVAFYAFGAGAGLLFDRTRPDWRAHYLDHLFVLPPTRTDPPGPS